MNYCLTAYAHLNESQIPRGHKYNSLIFNVKAMLDQTITDTEVHVFVECSKTSSRKDLGCVNKNSFCHQVKVQKYRSFFQVLYQTVHTKYWMN